MCTTVLSCPENVVPNSTPPHPLTLTFLLPIFHVDPILDSSLGLIHVQVPISPKERAEQSGFWRPKFGTDTHHLCVLLANTSKRTRWIRGGGGIKRHFLSGIVEKPRGIKSTPQSVIAGGMKDNGYFL